MINSRNRFLTPIIAALSIAMAMPMAVHAQDMPPPDEGQLPEDMQQQQPAAVYSQEQIDQMLAPIALYPDSLVAQILMASTYPLEVVEAQRWLQQPGNASLKGDQL